MKIELYLRSLLCHPHSCPLPAEDAAALNLKGLVINSFSLQLLNEPLRRNESSLPAPWPPQTTASGWERGCQTQWHTLFPLKGQRPWGTGTLNYPDLLITHEHPKATSLCEQSNICQEGLETYTGISTPFVHTIIHTTLVFNWSF